jgi:hypothetical protein
MIVASELENFPFIVKISSDEQEMKKQHKVFSIDNKMQIVSQADAHVGTRVDLEAVLALSVSTLNTIVSKWSEIKKSYLCCGPCFLHNTNH